MSASIGRVGSDRRFAGGRWTKTVVWLCMAWTFIILTGGFLLWPTAAEAEPTGKLHRIGFLGNSTAALEANLVGPFRDGLRDLGYVEGRNVLIEYRWAEGKYGRFPALISELIAQQVEVIVTAGTPAALAVKNRFWLYQDPRAITMA